MHLHVDPDVVQQAPGEELGLLVGGEPASMRHARLERLLVGLDKHRERQSSKVRQVIGTERQPKVLVTQALEFLLGGFTGIPFKLVVPLLGGAGEVVGG